MFKFFFKLIRNKTVKEKNIYLFVGYLQLTRKRNCFTTSLYKKVNDESQFYIYEEFEAAEEFKRVEIKGNVVNVPKNSQRIVKGGEPPIHSFITTDNNAIYGTREEIQPKLLSILYNTDINPNLGLIISSFLQLHGKTEKLLDEFATNTQNIHIHFDKSDFIDTIELNTMKAVDILEKIFLKLNILRKTIPGLTFDDIALFKNEKVFYNESNFSIRDILFDENKTYYAAFRKLVTMSSKIYFQMLISDSIVQQKKIDCILSEEAEKIMEYSVLDIGIKIEIELSGKKDQHPEDIEIENQENPRALNKTEENELDNLLRIAKKIKQQITY